jgi:hypothetical protein
LSEQTIAKVIDFTKPGNQCSSMILSINFVNAIQYRNSKGTRTKDTIHKGMMNYIEILLLLSLMYNYSEVKETKHMQMIL